MTARLRALPVAIWIALGLFAMALSRAVLMARFYGHGEPLSRAPAAGDFLGGIAIAGGWIRLLAMELPARQRFVGVVGAMSGVALTIVGMTLLSSAASAPTVLWIEVGATATALLAATAWHASETPVTGVLGWICLSFLVLVCLMNGDEGGGAPLSVGLLPIATWGLAGTAILGLRVGVRDPGLPSAILLRQ